MVRRIRVVVTGRVQNVGFRMFVQEHARAADLDGWVRNHPGGRQVELEAEGDDAAVERLLQAVRRGPHGARVETVHIAPQAVEGGESGFMVR